MVYHTPVLLHTCIEGLNIKADGTYVDVTFGGGGHSREILKHLKGGKLYAFDQDKDALANSIENEAFELVPENFSHLRDCLSERGVTGVDGILADLGVSSHQFDIPERGFSTRFDALLDMRMDQHSKLTAQTVINTYSETELGIIFKQYGEITNARRLAGVIFSARKSNPINTVKELKKVVNPLLPRNKENQYLAQLFQALRIEVNNELESLKLLLQQCSQLLNTGGRLVVISYHSLEDRLVKNFMRSGKFEGDIEKDFFGNAIKPFRALHTKPIVPSQEEVEENSRARSAKLRIAEKI